MNIITKQCKLKVNQYQITQLNKNYTTRSNECTYIRTYFTCYMIPRPLISDLIYIYIYEKKSKHEMIFLFKSIDYAQKI